MHGAVVAVYAAQNFCGLVGRVSECADLLKVDLAPGLLVAMQNMLHGSSTGTGGSYFMLA
jgi:hypothetical protein